MARISRTIFSLVAFFVAFGAQAAPTDTNITGTLAKAENTCVSPIAIFTNDPPQLCSYSGGEDLAITVGLGAFRVWMGPVGSGGFYATGTGPDPLTTGGSMPADGKAELPITGTIRIEDNKTPVNGLDDSISGTLVIGAGERSVATSDGTALEGFSSVTHTIPVRVVDSATENALGGYDYVIGTAGFPLLLSSAMGDYPSESASIVSGSPSPPDLNVWDVVNGGNVNVTNIFWPPGPPPTESLGPYTVEIVTYAPALIDGGNVGPNVGVATTAVVADHTCIAGDGAGNPTDDCDPDPQPDAPTTWVRAGAEFDNLIIKLSTDANNQVVSADAFYTLEYKIPALNANQDKPGSFIGGTLNLDGSGPPPGGTVPDQIEDLIGAVEVLGLTKGLEKSLIAKLDKATKKLTDDKLKNDHRAVKKLQKFIDRVDAKSGKKIAPADAAALIADAEAIIAQL